MVTLWKGMSSGVRSFRSEPQLCHSLAVWPQRTHFLSQSLSFFICKVRMVTLPLPLYVTSAKRLVLATLHGRHGQQLYFHSLHKKKNGCYLGTEWAWRDLSYERQTQDQRAGEPNSPAKVSGGPPPTSVPSCCPMAAQGLLGEHLVPAVGI